MVLLSESNTLCIILYLEANHLYVTSFSEGICCTDNRPHYQVRFISYGNLLIFPQRDQSVACQLVSVSQFSIA